MPILSFGGQDQPAVAYVLTPEVKGEDKMLAHGNLVRRMPVGADDQRAIEHVLLRYATGIDTRNWPLFRTCFTQDCEADYGSFGKWRGPREITEYMEASHRHMGHTLHRMTNIVIERDNEEVHARSYVDAVLTETTSGGVVHHAAGRYDDCFVRTSDGWKISRRIFTMVKAGLSK